jgi:hypothetical protein
VAKTLLQLQNEVGKNLRRSSGSTYTTIDQNQDAVMIMQLINEAKRQVEGSWKWDVLRDTVTFDSVATQAEYDLGDIAAITSATIARDRSYVVHDAAGRLQFWDITSGEESRMQEATRDRASHAQRLDSNDVRSPQQVAVFPNSDGLQVAFKYAPTGIRNYRLEIINPQDDLIVAGTDITVPWRPVVLAATAIAFDERGEELGGDSSLWWSRYEDAISREIDRDSTKADFQLIADTNYDNPAYWNA